MTRFAVRLLCGLILFAGCVAPTLAQDRVRPTASNVLYGADDQGRRRLDVYAPEGVENRLPVVVYFNGFGGDKSDAHGQNLPQLAAEAGAALVAVNYSLQLPIAYQDAWCAIGWIQANAETYNLDPTRVIPFGVSYGALPAEMLAVSGDPAAFAPDCPNNAPDPTAIRGMVSLGGFLPSTIETIRSVAPDSPQWQDPAYAPLFDAPPETWQALDLAPEVRTFVEQWPASWVSYHDPPHLLIHGAGDSSIPYTDVYETAELLARNRNNVTVVMDRLAGHVPGPAVFDRELVAFLRDVVTVQNWTPGDTRPTQYNLQYGAPDENRRRLDIFAPEDAEGPYPVVLAFHGSGADKSDIAAFAIPQLAAHAGAATVAVTYRTDDPLHAYQDAYCALAWLQAEGAAYDLDAERVVTLGHSYGGLPATMLGVLDDPAAFATDCPHPAPDPAALDGVISISGVLLGSAGALDWFEPTLADGAQAGAQAALQDTAPEDWLTLDLPAEARAFLSLLPMTHVDASEPPHLLVHGAEDQTIPYAQAFDYAGLLSRNRTSAVLVIDKYSGHVPPPFAYDAQMQAFLERAFGD